jgi:hypothetical protein
MFFQYQNIDLFKPDLERVYEESRFKFESYHGIRNNCSRTVRTLLSSLGVNVSAVTPWADTVRNLGPTYKSPSQLQKGDIVAMGRPGDTWHVGVYMGDSKVLHQSAVRGYRVGVYEDLNAFINSPRGFYFVRPNYPNRLQFEMEFFNSPELV